MNLHATYLGANGWLLAFAAHSPAALTVLVDPWFTGELVFPPGPWLLKGELVDPHPVTSGIDLLLLTQGLPDHCHPPSLSQLDRGLAAIVSPAAAGPLARLGFSDVTVLRPGQCHSHGELQVKATAGARVPQQENGYLLAHPGGRVYLEPHGFLDPDLPAAEVDAVISPVVDLGLPLAPPLVRGRQALPELLGRLRTRFVLASATGGDVRFSGLLAGLLRQGGTMDEAAEQVAAAARQPEDSSHPCRFIDPVPGRRYALTTAGAA